MKTPTLIARITWAKTAGGRLRAAGATRLLPLLLLSALPAVAQGQFDFNYTTNNGTITITEYTGSGGPVTIPGTINGLPVTSIGSYYTTQHFGSATVQGFFGAFQYSSVTSVMIPETVTNIPGGVLGACSNLSAITVAAANPAYSSVGGVLFDTTQTVLVQCPGGMTGSYTIPNSVTSVGGEAFYDCASLTGVTIPDSVTSIGGGAFAECYSLTSLTIPVSVTSIGDGAFAGCMSLTSVTIPDSVTSIGLEEFAGCSSLTSVTIPDSVTSIGLWAFQSCLALNNITIPNSVTSIGDYAFAQCTSLNSVTIGSGITNLGFGEFSSCLELRWVHFNGDAPSPNTDLTVFGGDNFANVYYLAGTTGWSSTFDGRPAGIWNPQVPYNYTTNNGTITITEYTGPGGTVTIPGTIEGLPVTSIGQPGFGGYFGVTSVTIPSSVTSIGENAFGGCTTLTNITIPSSVTSLGDSAFGGCTNLTDITIPNSVTNIGDFAFSECTGLKAAHFQGNAPSGDSSVFALDKATVYYLPGTTGWGPTFGGLRTALWALPYPVILNSGSGFGHQTNGFGFIISWATNGSVVVEATADLANPVWTPVATNTLAGGSSHFSDPQWTNYPSRFYRLRSP
jgi:hypothetical protein